MSKRGFTLLEKKNSLTGFTLLELVVVLIIISILAGLGVANYTTIVERGRAAEAKTILGTIRSGEEIYKIKNSAYTTKLADLNILDSTVGEETDGSDKCDDKHFFKYSITTGTNSFTATATRCTGTSDVGKTPQGPDYTIEIDQTGEITASSGDEKYL